MPEFPMLHSLHQAVGVGSLIGPDGHLFPFQHLDQYFVWRDRVFLFTALSFGLSLAPWIITKVIRERGISLRGRGVICFRVYLDDWLVLAWLHTIAERIFRSYFLHQYLWVLSDLGEEVCVSGDRHRHGLVSRSSFPEESGTDSFLHSNLLSLHQAFVHQLSSPFGMKVPVSNQHWRSTLLVPLGE